MTFLRARTNKRNQELTLKALEQTLETRQAQLFMNVYNQSFANAEFVENYREVMTSQQDIFSEVTLRLFDYSDRSPENPELVKALSYIVSFYEGLGVFVKEGLIDIRLVALTMTNMTRSLWERLAPIVKKARIQTAFPRLLSEFEYLYDELMNYIEEHPELKNLILPILFSTVQPNSLSMKMEKHWTEQLFIEKASLYGAQLEERLDRTDEEIEGLMKIFSEHKVPKGGAILDLACGIGRHSTLLAEKGYKVTGVDISATYIERARELASEKNVSKRAEFIVGDMRQVGELLNDREESFDVVVNLFTSMGFWDEETDRQIFKQACRLTRWDGILIIQSANRDFLVRHFQARDFSYGKDGRVVLTERRLDLESSRMFNVWRYYEQHGDDLEHLGTFEIDHRVYSLHELKKQIEESGWSFHSSYGGYDMQPLTTDTFGMIVVGKKSA